MGHEVTWPVTWEAADKLNYRAPVFKVTYVVSSMTSRAKLPCKISRRLFLDSTGYAFVVSGGGGQVM